jgi:hypothetical protein
MNRFALGSLFLAGALLARAVSHAQTSCTREGLKAVADLSIAAQAHGYDNRLRHRPTTVDLPVSIPYR